MSQEIGQGALNLQSGFVIAVIIAAVFVANRLGGDGALAQRAMQVAIGVALVLLVFSATTAFDGPPSAPNRDISGFGIEDEEETQEEFTAFAEESAERNSEVGTIHVGLGIIFVSLGVALFRWLRAIPTGFLLGGTLLLLLGAPPSGTGELLVSSLGLFGAAFPGGEAEVGTGRDIARFVVLLVGTLALLGATYWRWELPPTEGEAAAAPATPPGPPRASSAEPLGS